MGVSERTLADYAEVFNGKTPSKADQRDTGHPVLKIKDVSENGRFVGEFNSFVDEEYAEHFSGKKLAAGDTLILNAAHNADYVGTKQYFAEPETVGSLVTGEWMIVRPKSKVCDPAFLSYWLSCPETRFYTRRLVKGIHLYPRDMSRLKVDFPAIEEQKRIAAILDKADAIRRKRQQAIQLADEFLRSVFLEMFGDPVLNTREWPVAPLDEVALIRSGVTKGRDFKGKPTVHVPYMRVANVQDGYIDATDVQTIEILVHEVDKFLLLPGDLLLTEGGDPDKLGRGAVWQGEVAECVHQNHVFVVRPDENRVLPEFLSAQIGSQRGKRYFLKVGKQTTGIATINKTVLSEYSAILPPLALQQRYVDVRKRVMRMKDRFSDPQLSGAELFASVSQHAFQGKI